VVDALLARGEDVTVIDDLSTGTRERVSPGAHFEQLDVVELDPLQALFEEVRPDSVYHLAAQASVVESAKHPGRDCDVNVKGTLHVLEAAERHRAPVVFTSTGGALYGNAAPRPTAETEVPAPLSPYGASKWAAEAYVNTWTNASAIPHAICRLGNVYGPRQSPHGEAGVVSILTYHLYSNEVPRLFGHGRPTRDYVYVGDVVRALLAARGHAGTYNIATGQATDVATIWQQLSAAAGKRIEPKLEGLRPGELQDSCLDPSRAERELGWKPEVGIEEGLRITYEALIHEFDGRARA